MTARLPFKRPMRTGPCTNCGAVPLSMTLDALGAFERLARQVFKAEADGWQTIPPFNVADARAIIDAAQRGIRTVR